MGVWSISFICFCTGLAFSLFFFFVVSFFYFLNGHFLLFLLPLEDAQFLCVQFVFFNFYFILRWTTMTIIIKKIKK